MPDNVNTYSLEALVPPLPPDDSPDVITVDNVSMVFNMASQKLNSFKEYAIALARHELRFKEFRALNNIELHVKRGDVFGILGTNGSGKSTLLKIIAGVLEPSEGHVTINGNIAPLIELGAGFDMDLTAYENIYLNGAVLGYSKQFIADHFDDIVDFAEVRNFLDMPLKNYSSGMVARIAFAIATVMVPDILIVDEVLSVGDQMFQQKCERRIQTLIKEHQVTVLIVSHNTEQVERLCNKAIWIEKSHTRCVGKASDVCAVYRMLGGHIGSVDAEQLVVKYTNTELPCEKESLVTIAGENRYGTAAAVVNELETLPDTIILAPGEDGLTCMMANALCGVCGPGTAILLYRMEGLPDVTVHMLNTLQPKKIIVVGIGAITTEDITQAVRDLKFDCDIDVVQADSQVTASLAIYDYGKTCGEGWGSCAAVTHEGCLGDVMTAMPYIIENRGPIFYGLTPNRIDPRIMRLLSGKEGDGFQHVIVFGFEGQYTDDYLSPIEASGAQIKRLGASDPYTAASGINLWINEQVGYRGADRIDFLISSFWDLSHAYALAPYMRERACFFFLQDTSNLDSTAIMAKNIKRHGAVLDKLVFLGGGTLFKAADKQLLGRVLYDVRNPHDDVPATEEGAVQ